MPKKKAPSLPLYRNIAVSFSALVVLLIATIVYFSIARATITLIPRIETFPLTATVSVVREPSPGISALVGKVFEEEASAEDTFPASVVRQEDGKAHGTVRIMNTTGSAQTLIATTRFFTPEKVLFRLQATVVAPPRGEVVGNIMADVVGKGGEVGPTRFTIPGLRPELQEKIYGVSEAQMTGGTRAIARLGSADVARARATLVERIEATIRAREEPLTLLTVTPLASTLDAKLGAPVERFTVSVTARVRGVVVSERALHEWATTQLKNTLPDDERLLPLSPQAFTTIVSALDASKGTARLLVQGEGKALVRESSPAFDRARFVGRTPKEVVSLLRSHGGVADVKVKLAPFFVKRLPRLPDHIRVLIREP